MSIIEKVSKWKGLLPPLREVLSDNGVGSYARYSGFIIILSTIGWVTFLVIRNHALPDLDGPALFIAAGQGSYGVGQIKHIAEAARTIKQINANNGVVVQQAPQQATPADTPDAAIPPSQGAE